MKVIIVTDSTCDLPSELVAELGIIVIPMYINIGEKSYRDGIDISRLAFYENLASYPQHPATGTPGPEHFTSAYRAAMQQGASQILSIHVAESLSAVVNVARAAAADFEPLPVTVYDSGQLSLGAGFQVEVAARMAAGGATVSEIIPALQAQAARTFVAAGLETLEFLRRSGRMSLIMTGLGSMLQLKPILTMHQGTPASERVRTTAKAHSRLAVMLAERLPLQHFAYVHANAPQRLEQLRRLLDPILDHSPVLSVDITPVIGTHIGPGACGFVAVTQPTS